jgi:glycosyltransferase involved in cell wall biosynthesis
LKWPGKADHLIALADAVTCGNGVIRDHVTASGTPGFVLPPVVDPAIFRPVPTNTAAVPVIGWVGTHSTQPYVEHLLPVLEKLATERTFRVRLVGARDVGTYPSLDLEVAPWTLGREVADFQQLDIGLYPLPDDEWARGKAGLKAVQYMAVGRPYVVSAGTAPASLGIPGSTHLVAATTDDWYDHLATLLDDRELCATMGAAGRHHVLEHLTTEDAADAFAQVLHQVAGTRP